MSRPPSARPSTASSRQSSGRPTTGMQRPAAAMAPPPANRPGSSALNRVPGTATGGRPPPSAMRGTRVGTAAQGVAPRTAARPGTRMNTAGGVNPVARPVTQQGLSGVRPMTTRGQRQVLDKSYYIGLIRTKLTELTTEINRLNRDIDHYSKEGSNMATYEKRAEELAHEIEELRGELADNNTLTDRMNTNTNHDHMLHEHQQMKIQNDQEEVTVNQLFDERRQREEDVRKLEMQLETERLHAEEIMNNIDDTIKFRYDEVRIENEHLNEELAQKEAELEELTGKKLQLEEELATNPLKREAIVFHEKLLELQTKKADLLSEVEAEGTPEQQRERLLDKIKQDNQDIGTMEKQSAEIKEKINSIHEELKELEQEYEEQQGEKNTRYKELKIKEQQMDEFLTTFEETREQEQDKILKLERKVVTLLGAISKKLSMENASAADAEPEVGQDATPAEIQKEHARLLLEMEKAELAESEIRNELGQLQVRMAELAEQTNQFGDVDDLKSKSGEKKSNLEKEREELLPKCADGKQTSSELNEELTRLKSELSTNDNHTQIVNLEKKLQLVEQNNFALREIVEQKKAETNIGPVRDGVLSLAQEYNRMLMYSNSRSAGSAHMR